MPDTGAKPPDPTEAEIDLVLRGFGEAKSGNGRTYVPSTSFATGRIRFWIGKNKNGGIRACVFRRTPGSPPLCTVNDAPSERSAIADLIKWARAHPEPEVVSRRTAGGVELRSARLQRFRQRFRPTQAGTGYTYAPVGGVGEWRARFWIGENREPHKTPARVYWGSSDGGSMQHRTHYFATSQKAYAAMLDWADRRGWSRLSDFPANSRTVHNEPARVPKKRTTRRGRSSSPEPRSISTDGSIEWPTPTSDPSLDWNGSTEVDDWEPGDWERHYDRE